MSREQRLRAEELFQHAADLSRDQRSKYLDEECGKNPGLRADVESLLDYLEGDTLGAIKVVEQDDRPEFQPSEIGPYKIVELLGEGGFGSVYLAEQEEPIRRRVALKLIKAGMDTKQVIARFERERQALALMDHPRIARVLDAGATPTGRPYFVMERVQGIPVTNYCDGNNLSLRERLELFLQICRAVQYAHQKGIIHRDLKPSNVLVASHDGAPDPKIIDFGIAKAVDRRLDENTFLTRDQQFIGTPEYMSPEQAEHGGQDVDTRTDIYSLGVLLYELLTGAPPLDLTTVSRIAVGEIQRVIREEPPLTPSQRVSRLGSKLDRVARVRRLSPQALRKLIRGDLDWIVMKALEKDRTRRYETASALAADVEHHLNNEPVEAGPPGTAYRVGKFLRRHRVAVVTSSLVVVALVIGLAVATVGLVQATSARADLKGERDLARAAEKRESEQRKKAEANARKAEREADKAKAVTRFLSEMLSSVQLENMPIQDVTIVAILQEADKRIEKGALSGQPDVEADVRATLGITHSALGQDVIAEEHLRASVATYERTIGPEAQKTLWTKIWLSNPLMNLGKYVESEKLMHEVYETALRCLSEDHTTTVDAMGNWGFALGRCGRNREAEVVLRKATLLLRRDRGDSHPRTLAVMTGLAGVIAQQNRFAEAAKIYRNILRIRCRKSGGETGPAANTMINLASILVLLGKSVEAVKMIDKGVQLHCHLYGEEHPVTLGAMFKKVLILQNLGELDEAVSLQHEILEAQRRVLNEDHPDIRNSISILITMLRELGKIEENEHLIHELIGFYRKDAEQPDAQPDALGKYARVLLSILPRNFRDPEEALVIALRAMGMPGGNRAALHETLATAYYRTGDILNAIKALEKTVLLVKGGDQVRIGKRLIDRVAESGDVVRVLRAHIFVSCAQLIKSQSAESGR